LLAVAIVGLAAAFVHAVSPPQRAAVPIEPFRINVSDSVLSDLRGRLGRVRLPKDIKDLGSEWEYGTSLSFMRDLVGYWKDRYDWRAHEAALNQIPQFTASINGLSIHFLHVRSTHANALPLVITHGWPGSFVEFLKVIEPLTQPERYGGTEADAFHVVVPSIPGFAFSEPLNVSTQPHSYTADMWATLMAQLGYARYGVQGGDIGSLIGTMLAANHPSNVVGLHLNFCLAPDPPQGSAEWNAVTEQERARFQERRRWQANEGAYAQIQRTKPQALGFGLSDSPAGLASWIIDRFKSWCDCDGDPLTKFTQDELLTNVMLYWVNNAGPTSARWYYESAQHPMPAAMVKVPTACAIFPKELQYTPRKWVERRYNVVRWTEFNKGGHFAAMEQPDLFVQDIRAFFRSLR
jgi:microsomal epoxide hydrolase